MNLEREQQIAAKNADLRVLPYMEPDVVVVSYEILNADELHLTRKYRRYFHTVPKCRFSHKKRQFRKNEWCHICNIITEESSPKPKNESKFNFSSYDCKRNNFQYFSDSELCKMPLDFENSSMKNSFSMSSLQPSSRNCLEQSSQATNSTPSPVLPNRAYNSLNHKLKKRSPEQESWRNSWGQDDQKDEFWTSFESNYQYLMNNNLIDSCKEAKNDLNPSPSQDWTYSHFKERFLDLDSWLNSVQKTIYDNEDESIVQNVRLMMKRKNYQRKTFVNQSSRIVQRYPEHKDEILEFVSQVNIKYEKLAQTVSPKRDISSDCFSVNENYQYELKCLCRWIEAMEKKVEPLNFRKKWSLNQLKQKAKENEIENRDSVLFVFSSSFSA
ncbi:hypothetical protein V9T40_001164 [Parthenolecanium corni]|uniref:Uncharacterized protein n=1 Tax=Parthenolecanium corni TaxID=536013 RepID=A0AAN9TD21_9HEMI